MPYSRDPSEILGNAAPETMRIIADTRTFIPGLKQGMHFVDHVTGRLKLIEISINPKSDEGEKREARVVVETVVQDDMTNGAANLHGGCIATLIDVCSTLPLIVMNHADKGIPIPGVSQSLNIVYHSPAAIGDKIRIISTSLAVGGRIMSARCEIWNVTHHRLVASGVHVKMQPSGPKSKL